MKKFNIKPVTMILLLIGLSLIIGGTIAYYTSTDTFNNEFNASNYIIEVEENFESPEGWVPGDTTQKDIIATNRGDTVAAVRIKLTPSWKDKNGNPLSLTDGSNNEAAIINYAIDKDYKWIQEGDWYYYVRPIDKNESTSSIIESVTFNPLINIDDNSNCVTNPTTNSVVCTSSSSGYGGGTYELKINIETCQYSKYKEVWNTEVDINQPTHLANGRLISDYYSYTAYGKNMNRSSFESVATLDIINIPDNAIDSWDCSEEQNESVMCWYTDTDNDSKYELFIGQEGGVVANPNSYYVFAYFTNAEKMILRNVDSTQVEDMRYAFYNAGYNVTNFKFDASDWDVSNVTNFANVFENIAYTSKVIDVTIRNWKPSSTANVTNLFAWVGPDAENIYFDLTGWDFSNVKSMERLFYDFAQNCRGSSCPTVKLIMNGWNTSGVENMKELFNHSFYYVKDINLDFTGWDVSSVTNMRGMFQDFANTAKGTLRLDFTGWDTSHVQNMSYMFAFTGCYIGEYDYPGSRISLIGLNNWNVSSVTDMSSMFNNVGRYTESVNIGDLSNWNTTNVANMNSMFFDIGYYSKKVDFGSLKVYATNIGSMCRFSPALNGTFNIYSNPTSYNYAFREVATKEGTSITVNYASTTTNIDNIIATKDNNSNVVKGSILN